MALLCERRRITRHAVFVFIRAAWADAAAVRLVADRVLRNIGRRLAELRADCGVTQDRLAERLSISTRYVQNVEAGRVNVSVRALVEWANALDTPLAALLEAPQTMRARPGRPPRTRHRAK